MAREVEVVSVWVQLVPSHWLCWGGTQMQLLGYHLADWDDLQEQLG